MSTPTAPPGWPAEVRPPHAPDWERTAVAWLRDVTPPEWRGIAPLRRHPLLLARGAVLHVEGQQGAVRRGLAEARSELAAVGGQELVAAALEAWSLEEARLQGLRRAVGLVEEALRGRRWVARL
ncbi:hypothetical protein [Nocardioides perillae]|uniref:Uncharacterized protein n=1 Tax=Nocardioides perillae TaxID=1119534 RepID=A0A7Y9RX31_9ACTN|nr:hypothetical protein [Nocardioides perillae]NYG55704.1 hypothetical protein [Nocardioides perillae]